MDTIVPNVGGVRSHCTYVPVLYQFSLWHCYLNESSLSIMKCISFPLSQSRSRYQVVMNYQRTSKQVRALLLMQNLSLFHIREAIRYIVISKHTKRIGFKAVAMLLIK